MRANYFDAMQNDLLDQPQPSRPGEELDAARLGAFLKTRFPDVGGPLTVEQFPKGYSNLTYLIRVGDREMVLRRPPFGAKIKTAHDMGREFRILSHIERVYRKVPRPLAFCDDETVLGAPFFLMERVEGVILRAQPPAGLALSPPLMRQLSMNFIENLVAIHDIDLVAAGLGDLGKPDGYVARQVEGWTKRYRNARTDVPPPPNQTSGVHSGSPSSMYRTLRPLRTVVVWTCGPRGSNATWRTTFDAPLVKPSPIVLTRLQTRVSQTLITLVPAASKLPSGEKAVESLKLIPSSQLKP